MPRLGAGVLLLSIDRIVTWQVVEYGPGRLAPELSQWRRAAAAVDSESTVQRPLAELLPMQKLLSDEGMRSSYTSWCK